jgi:hypothetical protein
MSKTDFQNGFALGMASGGVVEVVPEKLLATKQDTLVSGENIKTINGESILGEGDLTVKLENLNPSWDTILVFDGGGADIQVAILDETILL